MSLDERARNIELLWSLLEPSGRQVVFNIKVSDHQEGNVELYNV